MISGNYVGNDGTCDHSWLTILLGNAPWVSYSCRDSPYAFLLTEINSFCMIQKLLYPWGPQFWSPQWHESPRVLLQVWKIPHTCPEHLFTQPLTPPATPLSPTPAIQISENEVRQVFRKKKWKKEHLAQTVLHQSVWNPVLTSWPPSSQRASTDHWSCAKSPHASNGPPSSPSQINPKLQDWTKMTGPKWLQACGSDSPGPSVDPLQFACRANKSVDDAVNMGLHHVLQHLDRPGTYVRILFVDFRSAFNTIIPNHLLPKLTQFSMLTSICQWITSFLTDRQQLGRLLRAAFSPHFSSPCTPMTAHLKTPLSSSWSLQMTPHWSASLRTVISLLTDRRLRSWLSGAVLTTWSSTCSKQ